MSNPPTNPTSLNVTRHEIEVGFDTGAGPWNGYSCTAVIPFDDNIGLSVSAMQPSPESTSFSCSFSDLIAGTGYEITVIENVFGASASINVTTLEFLGPPQAVFSDTSNFVYRIDMDSITALYVPPSGPSGFGCIAKNEQNTTKTLATYNSITGSITCSFTGAQLGYLGELYSFSINDRATNLDSDYIYGGLVPCFGGKPVAPLLFYSQTSLSSWTSDISQVGPALYGFKRYDHSEAPYDGGYAPEYLIDMTNPIQSISNSITWGYSDLLSFTIVAYASSSCGYIESSNTSFYNCVSVTGSFSPITYFYSSSLGFSYSVGISGLTGIDIFYAYEGITAPVPLPVNNSISDFLSYSIVNEKDISILAQNCASDRISSGFLNPGPAPPAPPPLSPSSQSSVLSVIGIAIMISVFIAVVVTISMRYGALAPS